ncbi:MAG: hypothetical protein J7L15_04695 [Clostridiales bacterium]|nr:hypothetical protein [Clostridiales bacterium]
MKLAINDIFIFCNGVYSVTEIKSGGVRTKRIYDLEYELETRAFLWSFLDKHKKETRKLTKTENPEYFL